MALRQLIISQRIAALRSERTALETAAAELANRRNAWEARESAAVAAFTEINENSTDEERAAFDTEAAEVEAERQALEADEAANSTRSGEIDHEIEELENELETLNARAKKPAQTTRTNYNKTNEGGMKTMNEFETRVHQICNNDEVRTFITNFRDMKTRGVKNVEYTIPTLMLPLIREATERSSKLLKHVNHERLAGEGTQNILGDIPEAVWTETIGKLNEIEFGVNQIRTGGSKLGAYVAVPNPYLEDSDEDLTSIIINYLAQSNGYGLDKAIIYGTGVNMPVGIMTRLAASAQPAWWQNRMPAFKALNTTHIGHLSAASVEGVKLYKEVMKVLGLAKAKYSAAKGNKFWAMSEDTYFTLQTELLGINAAGSIISSANTTMPVIGGAVEFLDFIPSGTIIGGHGSQYRLVERAGIKAGSSEHAQYIEDNTVFKATSRWDGIPVAGEGFAAFSLTTSNPDATIAFAKDKPNKIEE